MFGETLGEGQFGLVLAATASNIAGLNGDTQVAVKMVRPGTIMINFVQNHCSWFFVFMISSISGSGSSDLADIVTEYSLLRDLDHPNVIKLLGACTDSR